MSWLKVPDDGATPELERLTEPWRSQGARVPPVMAVLKRSPRAFAAVLELNYALAFGASSLGRRREELIAVWVSALNDCFFCLSSRLAANLRDGDRHALEQLAGLPGLEHGEAALLRFVAALSLAPESIAHADYEGLHAAGHSDAEILDAVLVAACFAFMNRLANGTGVTLDESKHAAAEQLLGRAALDRHLAWAARRAPGG